MDDGGLPACGDLGCGPAAGRLDPDILLVTRHCQLVNWPGEAPASPTRLLRSSVQAGGPLLWRKSAGRT